MGGCDEGTSEGDSAAGTVLVVDDDPAVTSLVREYLDQLSVVSTATETDPAAALERVDGLDLACVVSDYRMPGMDGIEFLTAVRDRNPDVPAVVFTSVDEEEVPERARERGARVIEKSGSAECFYDLVGAVEAVVEVG